jgi:hypothetical protein
MLMYFWLDTSRCSLYTHLTPYTNVRYPLLYDSREWLLNDYLSFFTDGFKGWGNVIVRDGWKCRKIPPSSHFFDK